MPIPAYGWRARVEVSLLKYAEERDWQNFYKTFIEGLRTVVAHYGLQQQAVVPARESR